MDRSYPYSRRLVTRARLRKRMVAVVAAGLVGATALFMLTWDADPISAAVPSPTLPLLAFSDGSTAVEPAGRGVRRIYPYSVVPGGVADQGELKRVIRTDRVVAAHYAGFDVDKARAVVVDKPRAVHVSYRKGDKVFWTARKVMLAPGETLLSDGSNEMRARCANRISDVPQYPVEAHQPAMDELDQPIDVAEGEQNAPGADVVPVSMRDEGGIGHTGMRLPDGAGAQAPAGAPAERTLDTSFSPSAADAAPLTATTLSGSSSSLVSRPPPAKTPATGTPETSGSDPVADSGLESGSSSGGGTTPVPQPDTSTETPVSTPRPDTGTSLPSPGAAPPSGSPVTDPPAPGTQPLPGTAEPPAIPSIPVIEPDGKQSGGGAGEVPQAPPTGDGPLTEPFIPKPEPGQTPPQGGTQLPEPASVPEPGSIWLFGAALAALLVLRRQRRG